MARAKLPSTPQPTPTARGAAKKPHGQYFTPADIADTMVTMLTCTPQGRILEPGAGEGAFLDALDRAGYHNLQAVEIDPLLLVDHPADVDHESFVSWKPNEKFDAVIGNPPYIRWKNLADEQRDELTHSPYWGTLLNPLSDYLTVFIAKSIDHLKDDGELIFITPAFWMHTHHAGKLRDWMLQRGSITHIVHFGESPVFPGVSSSIIIFRYQKGKGPTDISLTRYTGPRTLPEGPLDITGEHFTTETINTFTLGQPWTLAGKDTQKTLTLFEQWATPPGSSNPDTLGEACHIANGMVSGLDKAFRVDDALFNSLSKREKAATISVTKAAQLKELHTSDTCRYAYLPPGLTEAQARARYPKLVAHLEKHRPQLEQRYAISGGALNFWEWSFKRSEKLHLNGKAKVFVPCKERITNKPRPRFCVVPSHAAATQDVTAIQPKDTTLEKAEYFAAWLTLDETAHWTSHKGLTKGGVAEFTERPLAAIPVRRINWTNPREVRAHDDIVRAVQQLSEGTLRLEGARKAIRKSFNTLGLKTATSQDPNADTE